MKFTALLLVILLFSMSAYGVEIRDYINDRHCDQVLDKGYYEICYDYNAKGARYVGYRLDGDKVNAGNIKKRPRFYPDTAIPAQYRTYPADYTHNEFHADRGHLAPDASFDYSRQALHSVYSMANIIPQYRWINRKTWIKAEKYERLMASKLGTVTVINGVEYGERPKRLRKSGIAYPAAYWKMIYNEAQGFERCLYYSNDSRAKIKGDDLRDHIVDCAVLK
jgi:endonuclease G